MCMKSIQKLSKHNSNIKEKSEDKSWPNTGQKLTKRLPNISKKLTKNL